MIEHDDCDVRVIGVEKRFGDTIAVNNIDLEVKHGEFLVLLGASGCGKTTTLRMIGGFEKPDLGTIWIRGKDVTQLSPDKRDTNMVFQSYALFPHMTVYENIGFGLKIAKVAKDVRKEKIEKTLHLVKLTGYENRKPHQLSGGQQQRVALARAIINEPIVLLLDEPLGALDLKLRKAMQVELKNIQKTLGMTFIHVTHDQDEALSLADRVVVMRSGKIEQIGSPTEIYEKPINSYVCDFIGTINMLEGRVIRIGDSKIHIALRSGINISLPFQENIIEGEQVFIGIRPEKVSISTTTPEFNINLPGKVISVNYLGSHNTYKIGLTSGEELNVLDQICSGANLYPAGSEVQLHWTENSMKLFSTNRN